MSSKACASESLLAEWEAIGSSQSLSPELQNLFCMFLKNEGQMAARRALHPTCHFQGSLPPPKRFMRPKQDQEGKQQPNKYQSSISRTERDRFENFISCPEELQDDRRNWTNPESPFLAMCESE